MGTRKYKLVVRRASAERTRAKIIAAARALLVRSAAAFTIDAVAEEAGVARMTVYHQFGCKRGLLEALFDDLAGRSLLGKLRASFGKANPLEALDALAEAFAHFWHAERAVIRRLRAMRVIDADLEKGIRARDERRREHLRGIVRRAGLRGAAAAEKVDTLYMLTSFETFDALAGNGRPQRKVAKLVRQLARGLLT